MTVHHYTRKVDQIVPPSGFKVSSRFIPGLSFALDALAMVVSGGLVYAIRGPSVAEDLDRYIAALTLIGGLALLFMWISKLYRIDAIMRPVGTSDYVLVALTMSALSFLAISFALDAHHGVSRPHLALLAAVAFFAVCLSRVGLWRYLQYLARRKVIGRSMVVLGGGEQARLFLTRLKVSEPYFTSVLGVYADLPRGCGATIEGHPVLGDFAQLVDDVRRMKIDDIVIAARWSDLGHMAGEIEQLSELPVNVHVSSEFLTHDLMLRPLVGENAEVPVFEVVRSPISDWSSVIKRIEDYILATAILLLLLPLFAIVAIAIKIDSKGPVFFMQRRLGFNNKEFLIYKFRSMHHQPDESDANVKQAVRDDPRITRVGRIIRATSIDELPQLLNVLDGTMSLVGPRPHAISHNLEYGRKIRGYFARHRVKPGITGWAQVNGLRGETEKIERMQARVEHDIYYADNWSLLFDLRILVLTFFVVLSRKGAY